MSGRRNDTHHSYAIPIIRGKGNTERVGRAAEGIAEAVKMAGGKAVAQFSRKVTKAGEATEHDGNLRPTLMDSGTGIIAKVLATSKSTASTPSKKKNVKKSAKKRKHKRNKIDDVLGDDSY